MDDVIEQAERWCSEAVEIASIALDESRDADRRAAAAPVRGINLGGPLAPPANAFEKLLIEKLYRGDKA